MLEFIRTHRRLMQFMLLLIIVPSFGLVGLQSYTGMSDSAGALARVNGQSVSQAEFDAALRQQAERMRQMYGDQFDARLLDQPEARRGILDNLVAQKALAAEAAHQRISVSDATLQQAILAIPELSGADGKFDLDRYKALLAAQGMTAQRFDERLRQDMAVQQINEAVQATAFAPKSVAARLSDLSEQERTVQQQDFKAADYVARVKLDDAMLKAYYDNNASQFRVPESAKVEYVVLDASAIAGQSTVTDADIESYYTQNKKRYSTAEQRRPSHILFNAPKDAPAADKARAKQKAEGVLAQLRKNPADFAKLAKANSEDPGTAEKGGDLDFFGRDMMTKPFEDAAFKLRQGEISDVVQSDFGYHIIQVTAIKPAAEQPLAQVKTEIAAEIKKQMAARKYTEMAEQFSNMVYEQADSLKPVVDKLGLKTVTVDGVTRAPNPALAGNAVVNNAKFLNAVFTDDVLKNKHNTEAVEVAPSTLVSARVVDYKPASTKPFKDVEAAVRLQLTQSEAMSMARKAGEARLAALKAKPDEAGFSSAKVVSRKASELPQETTLAVLKADVTTLPAYTGIDVPGYGYSIARITRVSQPATQDAARRQAEQQQIGNVIAQQEMLAYIDVLKKKAKAEILMPNAAAPKPVLPE